MVLMASCHISLLHVMNAQLHPGQLASSTMGCNWIALAAPFTYMCMRILLPESAEQIAVAFQQFTDLQWRSTDMHVLS